MGQESPACHDFGWFCQGNHIISRANSWKTSHVNQHWHWLGALKNGMWGWFDNNFILGVGKEDFSIVGRRLLKLWVLVVSQCRCFGVFYWCKEHCGWQWVLTPKSHLYQKTIIGKSLKQKILTSFKEKPLMESLGKAPGTAGKPWWSQMPPLSLASFRCNKPPKLGWENEKEGGGAYFFFSTGGCLFAHRDVIVLPHLFFF